MTWGYEDIKQYSMHWIPQFFLAFITNKPDIFWGSGSQAGGWFDAYLIISIRGTLSRGALIPVLDNGPCVCWWIGLCDWSLIVRKISFMFVLWAWYNVSQLIWAIEYAPKCVDHRHSHPHQLIWYDIRSECRVQCGVCSLQCGFNNNQCSVECGLYSVHCSVDNHNQCITRLVRVPPIHHPPGGRRWKLSSSSWWRLWLQWWW